MVFHLQASPLGSLRVSTPPYLPRHLFHFCPHTLASTPPGGDRFLQRHHAGGWSLLCDYPRGTGSRGAPTLTASGVPWRLRLDLPAWKPQDLPLGQPRIHPFSLQASPCQEMLQKNVTIPHLLGQPGGPGQVAKPQGAHTPFYKIGPISNCQGGCEDWRRAVSRAWQQESSVRCQHSPSMGGASSYC